MADNLGKQPSKGILKNSSSFDKPESTNSNTNAAGRRTSKETKWDEMNIIATLHPADKDYGHMKIDEPKTPYNYSDDNILGHDELDANLLAEALKSGATAPPKYLNNDDEEETDEEDDLTEEEKARRKDFLAKRKQHYNEYYAVKLAKKQLEEELSEGDEVEEVDEMEVEKEQPKIEKAPSPPRCNARLPSPQCPYRRSRSNSPKNP